MRVPFNTAGVGTAVFTTHDPDTGARANADSTPTLTCRRTNYPFNTISLSQQVENPATGVYVVYSDNAPSDDGVRIDESFYIEFEATVGGVTQVAVARVDLVEDAQTARKESWGSETTTTFRITYRARGAPTAQVGGSGSLVGCLLHTIGLGEVRRITASTHEGSGVFTVTVDSAFTALTSDFLVISA